MLLTMQQHFTYLNKHMNYHLAALTCTDYDRKLEGGRGYSSSSLYISIHQLPPGKNCRPEGF